MKIRHLFLSTLAFASTSILPGQEVRRDNSSDLAPKMGWLRDVGISKDGKTAFAGDSERSIWVWDVDKRELIRVIRDPFTSHNTNPRYAFSADGKHALVGNENGTQRLGWGVREPDHERLTSWDLTSGRKLRAFEIKGESVYAIALSPDGSQALSASVWKTIPHPDNPPPYTAHHSQYKAFPMCILRLWDTTSGKTVCALGNNGEFGRSAFSLDGKFIVSSFAGPKPPFNEKQTWILKKWDTARREDLGAKTMFGQWSPMDMACIRLSPDNSHAAIGSGQGVSLWNLETGKLIWHRFEGLRALRDGNVIGHWSVSSISFSPDGKRLIAAGSGGEKIGGMMMIDVATGKDTAGFVAPKDAWVQSVSFTPDGVALVGACAQGLRFWDARTGETKFTLKD